MANEPTSPSRDSAQGQFFARPMYAVQVDGWPPDLVYPPKALEEDVAAPPGARLRMWEIPVGEARRVPPVGATVLDTGSFSLRNSGNRTLMAPKRSWKASVEHDVFAEMDTLNLKSMYNDASQMREALAWGLFDEAHVPAPRHTYARLVINGRFLGLFSVIEQVDKPFLSERFEGKPMGNLYKVYVGALGPGTLEHRVGPGGDDGGKQYQTPGGGDDQTYRLDKSYSDRPDAKSYEDLAQLVRVINGVGLAGGPEKFATDQFAESVHGVLAVEPFLRWAGLNVLMGAWDNYFATPANYFLYNATRSPGSDDVVGEPYFSFIPWDYDNTFGIDYFGAPIWQYVDLLDWPASTGAYSAANHHPGRQSRIPLVQNLLANTQFRRYYLDHIEHLLDSAVNPEDIAARIGLGAHPALWGRVSPGAYLESDTPYGPPFTGRQFTNHEVYLGGFVQQELRHGNAFLYGIANYVRMRYDSAREQLTALRKQDPAGSSGARFGG